MAKKMIIKMAASACASPMNKSKCAQIDSFKPPRKVMTPVSYTPSPCKYCKVCLYFAVSSDWAKPVARHKPTAGIKGIVFFSSVLGIDNDFIGDLYIRIGRPVTYRGRGKRHVFLRGLHIQGRLCCRNPYRPNTCQLLVFFEHPVIGHDS